MPEFAETPKQRQPDKSSQPARAFTPPKVLSEEVSKYAVRQDGILRIIGEGEIGDKARSLNRDAEGYKQAGLVVGERLVLAQSVLEDFLRFNNICNTLEEGNNIHGICKLILDEKTKFPPELEALLARLISEFPELDPSGNILSKLPNTSSTGFERCSLDISTEVFVDRAKTYLELTDEPLLHSFREKITAAATAEGGWETVPNEEWVDEDWQKKQKIVPLNDRFCAVVSYTDNLDPDREWLEQKASNPLDMFWFDIKKLNKYPSSVPAVVRSSAKGDDEGTGTYESDCASNAIESVCASFKKVLSAYYSPKAKYFRKKAGTGEGFGILIEPMAGSIKSDDGCPMFLPLYSGIATFEPGKEPAVKVDFGLGGGVVGGAEDIDPGLMKACGGKFSRYLQERIKQGSRCNIYSSKLIYLLAGKELEEAKKQLGYADYWVHTGKNQTVASYFQIRYNCLYKDSNFEPLTHADKLDFLAFSDLLKNAARALGKRRIEFAVAIDGGWAGNAVSVHVLQSSEIPEDKPQKFSTPEGELFCFAGNVVGNSHAKFKRILRPSDGGYQWDLPFFEQKMKGEYLLLVPQDLTSSNVQIPIEKACGVLGFGNVAGLHTVQYDPGRLLQHFPNFMKKTGRFCATTPHYPIDHAKVPQHGDIEEAIASNIGISEIRGAVE